jgi:type III pantothenate kinase
MSKLLLDVGNTRVKWARVRAGMYEYVGALPLAGLSVEGFLQQVWPEDEKPSLVVMACVGEGEWVKLLRFCIANSWASRLLEVVSEAQKNGLKNGYAQPSSLGVDRWCALLGAWQMHQQAVCVVDAGTALTIDVINNGGEHLGGLIVPGLLMMRQCLRVGTAQVAGHLVANAQSEDVPSNGLLGRNTTQAVAGGALWSLAASVERLANQATELVGGPMHCVLTGGDAQQLLPLLSGNWLKQPDLVLRGLLSYTSESLAT